MHELPCGHGSCGDRQHVVGCVHQYVLVSQADASLHRVLIPPYIAHALLCALGCTSGFFSTGSGDSCTGAPAQPCAPHRDIHKAQRQMLTFTFMLMIRTHSVPGQHVCEPGCTLREHVVPQLLGKLRHSERDRRFPVHWYGRRDAERSLTAALVCVTLNHLYHAKKPTQRARTDNSPTDWVMLALVCLGPSNAHSPWSPTFFF